MGWTEHSWNGEILACHPERQRRISRAGYRDPSLTLRMKRVSDMNTVASKCEMYRATIETSHRSSRKVKFYVQR